MIAENLSQLNEKINQSCKRSKRELGEIKLIAVSKYFGLNSILEVKSLGLNDFGENRAQELTLKFDKLSNYVVWHFIGTLQKNKVKYVVKTADYIHSVDSSELVDEINNRAEKLDKVQKILLEIKTSNEDTKSGLKTKNEIIELVKKCSDLKNIQLVGLMTMAPLTDDEKMKLIIKVITLPSFRWE
jgi:pyridoxal phosphate enzyme (YggS family)